MDKSWMHIEDRLHSIEYAEGVRQFISMAISHTANPDQIRCPCRRCRNRAFHSNRTIEDHLFFRGIDPTYTPWIFHGEDDPFLSATFSDEDEDDMLAHSDYIDDLDELLDDIRHGSSMENHIINDRSSYAHDQPSASNAPVNSNFEDLVADARRPLYPTCTKFSKLSFIVKLLHIKSIAGWMVKSFDMVIKLLHEAFPDTSFPDSYNDARRLERGLGFSYEKIHVCPNDCILFWKENASFNECPKCKASRWEQSTIQGRRIPQKTIQHLASTACAVQLAPWACMKEPYTMLSLLIPGPKSPGNDIDVFLHPLLDKLKELWEEGIHTYDAYSGEHFMLHAALLWTINDFPAYANISGWSTKGKMAYPHCTSDTNSQWLVYGCKHYYMGHRRWLAPDHSWRQKKNAFNGHEEHQLQPSRVEGEELHQ
ncbi:uncharacterized protein LOC122301817 [Carya illinoinensis]|uniref:uncharacterized protein LOC122301817 n=1 Tax=Carya illinoinensis TaxID=32201 RepID=UPI001C71ED21|nr:uncharacterized protein LOC122301817 [Carya illinoinensis]